MGLVSQIALMAIKNDMNTTAESTFKVHFFVDIDPECNSPLLRLKLMHEALVFTTCNHLLFAVFQYIHEGHTCEDE